MNNTEGYSTYHGNHSSENTRTYTAIELEHALTLLSLSNFKGTNGPVSGASIEPNLDIRDTEGDCEFPITITSSESQTSTAAHLASSPLVIKQEDDLSPDAIPPSQSFKIHKSDKPLPSQAQAFATSHAGPVAPRNTQPLPSQAELFARSCQASAEVFTCSMCHPSKRRDKFTSKNSVYAHIRMEHGGTVKHKEIGGVSKTRRG